MGQCCTKKQNQEHRPYKQNKNIDDKRMFKVGVEVLRKDFCVQIGYNRRAVKNYSDNRRAAPDVSVSRVGPIHPNNDELTDTQELE